MKLERSADDVCAAFLLERELFEEGRDKVFPGEVSGVIRAGAFITFKGERSDVYEGFFPARRMRGDRYEINDVESALIGVRTGRRVGYGDRIEVKVDSVEAPRGRVDLLGAEREDSSERGGPRRGGRPRSGGGR
jgi:ribonuclease R